MASAPATVLSGRVAASSVGDVPAGVEFDSVLAAAQVAAGAVSRWLYPDVDAELLLLDLSADAEAHKDFLRGWVSLVADTHAMMPFTQVCFFGGGGGGGGGLPCVARQRSVYGCCGACRCNRLG
jgi:hypothetical protein